MQPGRIDGILLSVGGIAAVVSTLRLFGDGLAPATVALLAGGILCAAIPLLRLLAREGKDRRLRRTMLAAVFTAHLAATLFFFPPEDLVNGRPVLTLDHAVHYYQAARAREVFPDRLQCSTWDPYFMAGYPGGTVFDVDSKGVELWCSLLRPVDAPRAYKLFIILGYLLLPCTVYAGIRRMGFAFDEALGGLLVLLVWWHWGRPFTGHFRYAGMFSYLTVIHLSIYLTGLFRSVARREGALSFYLVGPLAFLIHPTAAVLLPIPFLAVFFAERRRVPDGRTHRLWERRLLGRIVLWSLLVLAANAVWIVQLWRYLDIKIPSQTFFQISGPLEMGRLLMRPGTLPAIGMLALAAAGTALLAARGRGREAAAPVAGSLFLLFISCCGVHIPLIDQMEPGRFIVGAFFFMTPLAGTALAALPVAAERAARRERARKAVPAVVYTSLLLCIPVAGMLSARGFYRHHLHTTFTPEVKEMLNMLDNTIDTSGRLMIDDGPAWNYGESFLPSLIPLRTGVEQIGGPYPFAFIRHNFTNFSFCHAFGRHIGELGPDRFRRYLDVYNIHWILTASEECRETVAGFGIADEIWSSRHFTLWSVPSPSSFTDTPGVSVESRYGVLQVRIHKGSALRPGSEILLKYHWDRGMSVEPPARIYPRIVLDDPVPFTVVEPNGASTVQIIVR